MSRRNLRAIAAYHMKSLLAVATDSISTLLVGVRAAFSSVSKQEENAGQPVRHSSRDFEAWLHGDPLVTENPANRYGDDAPGYITGNGLGSLEIGAADD